MEWLKGERVIQEIIRTMLNEKDLARNLWVEAINTASYLINRVYITKNTNKTPYELYYGRKPNLGVLESIWKKVPHFKR